MTFSSVDAAAEDELLMGQLRAGSVEAFEKLYDRYCDRAYRIAWGICRDTGRAEDAVQEAFMSIWRTGHTYRPERGTVAAWLLSTVRYRAIDCARRDGKDARQRTGEEALHDLAGSSVVAEQVVSREEAHQLHELLAKLPAAQREVIMLAFYGQLTHTEISAYLRLPEGTIKGRMRLGLNKLRDTFDRVA